MSGFLSRTIERAKMCRKTIVLPESTDLRILEAAAQIQKLGFAQVVLLGNRASMETLGDGLDFSQSIFVDPSSSEKFEEYSRAFYELRKAKGISLEDARECLRNPLYWGVMMVKMGDADGMVAGAANSSADTLRPALQILKTTPGTKIVSSFFVMVVPDCEYGSGGTFIYSDCGLIENPSAEELAEIAVASASTCEFLMETTPRVAMLSYSSYGSAKHHLVDKVVEAVRLAKLKAPDMLIDGELQVDAAIVPSIAATKAPGSPLEGRANVLVFPDLNSGNISYKLTQRLARADAYGPITQGIAFPVNDLSRGCNSEDIVGVVAITAVQAQRVSSAQNLSSPRISSW